MNAFVMLEERPVIFIGVGIRNRVKYSIGLRSNDTLQPEKTRRGFSIGWKRWFADSFLFCAAVLFTAWRLVFYPRFLFEDLSNISSATDAFGIEFLAVRARCGLCRFLDIPQCACASADCPDDRRALHALAVADCLICRHFILRTSQCTNGAVAPFGDAAG